MRALPSLLLLLLAMGCMAIPAALAKNPPAKTDIAAPVLFIANGGQWPESVLFGVRQGNIATYLEKTIITTQFFQTDAKGVVIKAHFLEASAEISVRGEERTQSKFNFLKGSQEDWKTGVTAYKRVAYKNLYPDTDMEISAGKNGVEQVFILNKKAAPDIRVKVEGIKNLAVNDKEELVMTTELGDVLQSPPTAFRLTGAARKKIPAHYKVIDNSTYTFSF